MKLVGLLLQRRAFLQHCNAEKTTFVNEVSPFMDKGWLEFLAPNSYGPKTFGRQLWGEGASEYADWVYGLQNRVTRALLLPWS